MNYKTLPRGYRFAGTMDFMRNRRQMIAVAVISLALTVLAAAGGLIAAPPSALRDFAQAPWYLWLALVAALIAYIPLHELTHGAVMFALSGVRPRYGLKLPYAYAGSAVWFDRRSHIATALAPLLAWGILFQAAIAALPSKWFWFLWIMQISNLSGSAGDIYCAWALARMEGDLLIQDSGVRMRIFRRHDTTEETNT